VHIEKKENMHIFFRNLFHSITINHTGIYGIKQIIRLIAKIVFWGKKSNLDFVTGD
jgi:hypothetical protein